MKNSKKLPLSLKKITISKFAANNIVGGSASNCCTTVASACVSESIRLHLKQSKH
ncbi:MULTISPECIES: hypothetical protein [Maribacter]|uniref:Uncharacterized protein n=1 Tax=Maribacter ulvicola TaxID=228959 RepID=A0A1N6PE44_9FLAO|nr:MULTISPECIES: hypothetical protein [Maribacter]SIQ02496.1 hypothetical protein SAMN05421797_101396 [Maribacter ulvicola]